jgi:diamine N-acetyltransferase
MQAELKPVDQHNFATCVSLSVAPDQVDFVASNLHSLAEAYAFPAFQPRAVYVDGTMVGFLMFGFGDQSNKWWIIRLISTTHIKEKATGEQPCASQSICSGSSLIAAKS